MRQSLHSFLVISFFGGTLLFSNCKKTESIIHPTASGTPTLVTHNDSSTVSIPDINAEKVPDLRLVSLGTEIYKNGYIDQPCISQFADSSWVCVFTTGGMAEGATGQHIMWTRSTDLGKTWSKAGDIEPITGISSGWAIPYVTSYGRLYVFYTYNGDNFTSYNGKPLSNSNLLGWYCYKYSDDMGKTWSKRYRLPLRVTAVDRNNTFKGTQQMFWGICKPLRTNKGLLFSFTKVGQFINDLGEGWLFNCPNIETEKNADDLQWKMLPDGDFGIRNPNWSMQEEHNVVQMNNGSLYLVNRTTQGYPAFSTSADFGSTWTVPTAMRYGNGTSMDRIIKHPLACARILKCKNGNYILWYHNNGTTGYENRNPVWVAGGVEVNGTIWWSEPEILLYSKTATDRFSYPDLVEQEGRYFIAESAKTTSRVHELSGTMLNDLWYQRKRKTEITAGLILDHKDINVNTIPADNALFTSLTTNGGFTIDLMLKFSSLGTVDQIFSNVDAKAKGVKIVTTANKTIKLTISDGTNIATLETDPDLLAVNTTHHIAFTVDAAANIITAMVDGKLCDGGAKSAFGWVRFSGITDVNTTKQIAIGSDLKGQITRFRVYGRALRTSELVSQYKYFN